MIILNECHFFENTSIPCESKSIFNIAGDTLAVQISGSNGVFRIEGRNCSNGEWIPLAGVNLNNFGVTKGDFVEPGLYEIGIVSVRELRAKIVSTNGPVSIVGQIISTAEV